MRSGVIRTIGSTGGVITSAGLIFAASMFGLVFSSISAAVQVGFMIGVGLLLDTFLVRTVTVPALAVLVGRANWWPSRPPRKRLPKNPTRYTMCGRRNPGTMPMGISARAATTRTNMSTVRFEGSSWISGLSSAYKM